MKLNDIVNEANYGRYYCSTDKKWKTRKGPKQTRKTESVEQGVAESEYGIPDETLGRLPDGPKMTFGEFKKMWPGVILKRPSGGSLAGSVVADVEGWMNNPKSVWEPLKSMAEGSNGISVDIEPELDYDVVYVDINGKKYNFNYWYSDEKPTNELEFRKDIPEYLKREEWYNKLDNPTKMEVLHAVVQAELGNEPSEYKPTVGDEPLDEEKRRLDPKCWTGYKKQGTKMKGGVRVNNCVPEAAPDAVRAAGGLALGSLTGVGGALIGQMFAPFLGGAAGGVVGAVGGYKAGAEMTDALWDKVSSMLGGKDKAVYAGIEHAKAANAGKKTFNYNGKEFPVTLAPQEVKPAISALDSVKESILGELIGWGQASKAKKPVPKRNEPTAGERLAKSGDKRSELQRKFDAGKKNWFAEEETYDGDEFYEAYGDLWFNEDEQLDEAEYQGRKVPLGKPMRGDVKKFKVYVKNEKGNVVKVNFGDPDMKIKKSNPARRKSFRARHNCANPGPRTKARYWSCRKW